MRARGVIEVKCQLLNWCQPTVNSNDTAPARVGLVPHRYTLATSTPRVDFEGRDVASLNMESSGTPQLGMRGQQRDIRQRHFIRSITSLLHGFVALMRDSTSRPWGALHPRDVR